MSIVLITHHDESIYNVASPIQKSEKMPSPRKISKQEKPKKQRQPTAIADQKMCATMGPPEYPPPDTRDYLKKNTWKPPVKTPSKIERDRTIRAAPIPHRTDAIKEYEEKIKAMTKQKNFIVENIKYVVKLKPKEPEKKLVLDCHGDSKDIKRGLEPHFLHSSNFGKTPKYLKRLVEMREKDLQLVKDITVAEHPKCRYITKEERDELLAVRKIKVLIVWFR